MPRFDQHVIPAGSRVLSYSCDTSTLHWFSYPEGPARVRGPEGDEFDVSWVGLCPRCTAMRKDGFPVASLVSEDWTTESDLYPSMGGVGN